MSPKRVVAVDSRFRVSLGGEVRRSDFGQADKYAAFGYAKKLAETKIEPVEVFDSRAKPGDTDRWVVSPDGTVSPSGTRRST